ncbi:hypothetical protein Pyrfu_1642 [Pyrolobus fumarii 1A]|uniref:Uncharacterized protein n=2 Tax=Pyrolobus fumarii TaxID=54252 RepID=G0ECC8_PYRF1|nr:hypothetical protein Pyrfu_1642 [Pyrolobus fumarii 1A]
MERGGRFEAGKEAVTRLTSSTLGVVLVGIWWSGGLIPLCLGSSATCSESVEYLGIVGGRGCWDQAIVDTLRLLYGGSVLVVVGCCRGPCSKWFVMPTVFRKRVFYCVAGYSERVARTLQRHGFDLVTSSWEEVERFLGVA